MPIIAVMNRKGGSGKSTLATQIAAWYAFKGAGVMLGDSDRQRSTSSWLRRRNPSAPAIATWPNDLGRAYRLPAGTVPVVVDTSSGIFGLELAKQLARVDAIVVPVGPSVFDLETSIEFLEELRQHPRVVSGRCQVAVIGMRWPQDVVQAWQENAIPRPLALVTVIPDAPRYRQGLEAGNSVFDNVGDMPPGDLQCWQPLLQWLDKLPQRGARLSTVSADALAADGAKHAHAAHRRDKAAAGTASPPTRQRGAGSKQLRSPESFVETLPPEDISPEELQAVRRNARKQVALDMGQASAPAGRTGIFHPELPVSLRMVSALPMPGTNGPRSGNGGSEHGWLTRILKGL